MLFLLFLPSHTPSWRLFAQLVNIALIYLCMGVKCHYHEMACQQTKHFHHLDLRVSFNTFMPPKALGFLSHVRRQRQRDDLHKQMLNQRQSKGKTVFDQITLVGEQFTHLQSSAQGIKDVGEG